ncbi:MAG: hypothetical protein GYB31_12355 [Bacteroidetes bacterium]|nr:hypothetical protein [Bacteroidota bacterium]
MRIYYLFRLCFLLAFFGLSAKAGAQAMYQFKIGLHAAIGMPVNRVGISVETTVSQEWFALQGGIRARLNGSGYGPAEGVFEWQTYAGFWLGVGEGQETTGFQSPQVSTLDRKFGLSYQVNHYLDNASTSQWTGTVRLKFGRFYILSENDALAPLKARDRFRSGAASFMWQGNNRLYELRTVLWHGDSGGEGAFNVSDSDYPCRFGYRDYTACQYGGYSNGVLAIVVHEQIPFHQNLQYGIGLDAEQIRNFVQNTLIHDMWFFPPAWTNVRNRHYPMLTEDGDLYLYEEGQKIRPIRAWFQIGLNQDGFY